MKDADNNLHEKEISRGIRAIAVQKGLRLPQTPAEVALFEERFARDIDQANRNPPPLTAILELAATINNLDELVVVPLQAEPVDPRYGMAARGGKTITSDIDAKLDEAVLRVTSEKKSDE